MTRNSILLLLAAAAMAWAGAALAHPSATEAAVEAPAAAESPMTA